jgi:hypothetical protein
MRRAWTRCGPLRRASFSRSKMVVSASERRHRWEKAPFLPRRSIRQQPSAPGCIGDGRHDHRACQHRLTTLTSNGTTAIEIVLRSRARSSGGHCFRLAFTFIASAHAVCNAGLTPYLLETDPKSVTLTPEIAAAAFDAVPEPVAAVLVVGAFGAPQDLAAWAALEERHGILGRIRRRGSGDLAVWHRPPKVEHPFRVIKQRLGEGAAQGAGQEHGACDRCLRCRTCGWPRRNCRDAGTGASADGIKGRRTSQTYGYGSVRLACECNNRHARSLSSQFTA